MLTLATLLALAQTAPAVGPIKVFGDWVVACDNLDHCEMTSLIPGLGVPGLLPEGDPGDSPEYNAVLLSVSRTAGPDGGFTVDLMMQVPDTGLVRISIDGTTYGEGVPKNDALVFTGATAAKMVAAMAAGENFNISDSADTMIGRVSLSGSSAALRFIDAEQGRAGTVTAAVAKGAKPASAVPAVRPIPSVRQVRPGGTAATITPALKKAMFATSGCGEEYGDDLPEVEAGALGGGTAVALIPCGAGAYNYLTVPFVIAGGKPVVAQFDYSPGMTEPGAAMPMLVNADYDPKTGKLSSYSKGRGIGDCGSSEEYVWDGAMFRLTGATQMIECRGSPNWLTVWQARPAAQ